MRRLLSAVLAATVLAAGSAAVAAERLLLPEPDGEVLTLLLMGSDDGPPRGGDPLSARADSLQLLFVSGDRQHASFVSLPRDSWIPVAGRGTTRINACLNNGPENCVATLEAEFGVEVDGYLATSMNAMKRAVETFGGLVVDVPVPLYNGGMDIPETGRQRLTGSQALTYGRDRKNRASGDFGRARAQAEMLAIAHAEVVSQGGLTAALDAAAILRRHTDTDLSGPQLARLALEALQLPPDNVQRELAPAQVGRAGAASVVFLQPAAYELIDDAADDARIGASGG